LIYEELKFSEVLSLRRVKKNAESDFFSEAINYIDFFLSGHILYPGKEFGGFFSILLHWGGRSRGSTLA
jgi:hypothetical protein